MPHTLQFVDKIDASPTLRLDLNAGKWKLLRDPAPDFSPPSLKRAVVSTLLRDGSEIPATAYENRVVKFRLYLQGTTEDDLATEAQKLHRELDRARNVLKWQPAGATSPVFFRTHRSPDYRLRNDDEVKFRLFADLAVVADPFAYGLKVSLSPVTVNNDPAAGSNPCRWDIAAASLTGDVPTPGYFNLGLNVSGKKAMLAVRRHGTPGGVYAVQAEGLTQGTDTATQPNDTAFSGVSNNYSRTSFATATAMTTRLTHTGWPDAGSNSVEYRGRYRVFARVRQNGGAIGDINVRILYGNGQYTTEKVPVPVVGSIIWMDMGILPMPAQPDPISEGYSNAELSVATANVRLQAERVTGSATLDWDVFLAVPADEELCIVQWDSTLNTCYLDGPQDKAYSRSASQADSVESLKAPAMVGSIPLLSPNQINRIALLQNLEAADTKGNTTSVTVSFWPRFLYIRP